MVMLKNFIELSWWKRALIVFPVFAVIILIMTLILFDAGFSRAILISLAASFITVLFSIILDEAFRSKLKPFGLAVWSLLKLVFVFLVLFFASYAYIFDSDLSKSIGFSSLIVLLLMMLVLDREILNENFLIVWWKRVLIVFPVFALISTIFLIWLLDFGLSNAISFSLIASFFLVIFLIIREKLEVIYKNATGRKHLG